MVLTVREVRMPAPSAMAARSTPEAVWVFCMPVSPNRSLSSTAMVRFAGFSTAMYDPAARGSITELTPPERRGEAFGLYSAAQMGGLLFGPAIGGLGASVFGGVAFVFVFGAVSSILAAVVVGLRVPETAGPAARATPSYDTAEFPGRPALVAADDDAPAPEAAPPRLINRLLVA